MGYTAVPERLFPGEAPFIRSSLPWAFMSEDDKRACLEQSHECADCGMSDLPWVPGWRLCMYCVELRQVRRSRSRSRSRRRNLLSSSLPDDPHRSGT